MFTRWVTMISTMCAQIIGSDAFQELYSNDSSFEQIYVELISGGKRDNFIIINEYLFCGLQLCILGCTLREHIIWLLLDYVANLDI